MVAGRPSTRSLDGLASTEAPIESRHSCAVGKRDYTIRTLYLAVEALERRRPVVLLWHYAKGKPREEVRIDSSIHWDERVRRMKAARARIAEIS